MKTPHNKLARFRAEIATLVNERENIAGAPIPRDEAAARIAAIIDAQFNDQVFDPAPAGLSTGSFDAIEFRRMLERPGLLAAVIPAELKRYLLEKYDAELVDATPGLAAVERRARLDEIKAKIFRLEVEEEELIEQMEAEGTHMLRRPEASAIAQLGLDPDAGEPA